MRSGKKEYFSVLWLHLMVFSIKWISVLKRLRRARQIKNEFKSRWKKFFFFFCWKKKKRTPYSCNDHHSWLTWKPFQKNFLYFLSARIRKNLTPVSLIHCFRFHFLLIFFPTPLRYGHPFGAPLVVNLLSPFFFVGMKVSVINFAKIWSSRLRNFLLCSSKRQPNFIIRVFRPI